MKTDDSKLGMSILISHPDSYSIEEQIPLFADAGFDSFFLSCGVTEDFSKIPIWAEIAERSSLKNTKKTRTTTHRIKKRKKESGQ